MISFLHEKLVFNRRINVLANNLSVFLTDKTTLLDVGCGDGHLDTLITKKVPNLSIEGIDVLIRPHTHIPVKKYDGITIPYGENSVDTVMFVDVLHHTEDPESLLAEAKRVARHSILIKDHLNNSFMSETILKLMDWVGNRHHNVVLPYNYLSQQEWEITFSSLNLKTNNRNTQLGLYPFPVNLIFEKNLHFIAELLV
jgi:ubiquinone/menaquinone biosynthesis C-methylase UbiE